MTPVLSICIPTYNRAAFLDECLGRLPSPDASPIPFEVVISDNGSTDETPAVIAAHVRRNPAIRAYRQPENRGVWSNLLNVFHVARGAYATYLADDDALMFDNLLVHVNRMEQEPDLATIFTDWIAWDDERGCELHRYFNLAEAVAFGPEDPLGLLNFILRSGIGPEIGLYRRRELLAARPFFVRTVQCHPWMYALSRRGRIRFDPLPYYREQRMPRKGLQRDHWANMGMQFQYIGDEMRLSLETMVLQALQDANAPPMDDAQTLKVKRAIDRILHQRTSLEIERACGRGDFILAVELRRRQVLWDGPGSAEDVRRDALNLTLPATAQAVGMTFEALSEVKALRLKGFSAPWLANFLARWRPQIPVTDADGLSGEQVLVVHRDERSLAADRSPDAAQALVFSQQARLYRVAKAEIDLSGL